MFSEPLLLRYSALALYRPDGRAVDLPDPDSARANRELIVRLPALTRTGAYRVEWRATAADGHVATGAFGFTLLLPPAAATPPEAEAAPARSLAERMRMHHVDPRTLPPVLRPDSVLNGVVRFLEFLAILGLIGAAVSMALLLPGAGLMPTVQFRVRLAVRRFAGFLLLLLLLVLPVRLWLQSAALHGPARALDPALLGMLLTQLAWGQAWLAQVLAALLAGVAIATGFVPLLGLAAILLAATPAFQGHAAAIEPLRLLGLTADGLHVLAAGAWIGTLAVMLTTVIPILFRDGLERGGHDTSRVLQRFSPIALSAAALLAMAGTISAALHFHSALELLTTGYGRVLLLKLAFVGIVLLAGWFNWKRARPALPAHTGVRAFRRGAFLELLFATLVLVVTAVLVGLATP